MKTLREILLETNYKSFQDWYDDADMPEKDSNGNWYDLETGLYYEKPKLIQKKKTTQTSEIQKYRNFAKENGGQNLKGTTKQKDWAEKIRYDVINNNLKYNKEYIKTLLKEDEFQHSKFWIENRGINDWGRRLETYLKLKKTIDGQEHKHNNTSYIYDAKKELEKLFKWNNIVSY